MWEFFVYATDADHALEILGNSADTEFHSLEKARAGYDPDVHELRDIYRVQVDEAWKNPAKAAEIRSTMK